MMESKMSVSYQETKKCHLKSHIQSVHEGVTFDCEICNFKETRKGRFKSHVESVHVQLNIKIE